VPDGLGYLKFENHPILDGPAGTVELKIDGYVIQGAIQSWSSGWAAPGARILMADGTFVTQGVLPKPKQPKTMAPRSGSFDITVAYQNDLIRIHRAAEDFSPVLAFFGEPRDDRWLIRNGESGQTEWRTSRRVAYNATTITHATHPPQVYIKTGDSLVEQTIVTSGTPTSGQAKVLTSQTSGQYYETVTTPALTAGDELIFHYWPELLVYVSVSNTIPTTNFYQISVTLEEVLAGVYE
jgi:hypothetical protein